MWKSKISSELTILKLSKKLTELNYKIIIMKMQFTLIRWWRSPFCALSCILQIGFVKQTNILDRALHIVYSYGQASNQCLNRQHKTFILLAISKWRHCEVAAILIQIFIVDKQINIVHGKEYWIFNQWLTYYLVEVLIQLPFVYDQRSVRARGYFFSFS